MRIFMFEFPGLDDPIHRKIKGSYEELHVKLRTWCQFLAPCIWRLTSAVPDVRT